MFQTAVGAPRLMEVILEPRHSLRFGKYEPVIARTRCPERPGEVPVCGTFGNLESKPIKTDPLNRNDGFFQAECLELTLAVAVRRGSQQRKLLEHSLQYSVPVADGVYHLVVFVRKGQ